ncbi:TPA: hypothetical protein NV462_000941 [Acinetobacter baumannii]|nr:hypothetical protein [Acinetobacter baumannii]HCJ7822797.1 hypothetical protein [Acinetobacter baumannii]
MRKISLGLLFLISSVCAVSAEEPLQPYPVTLKKLPQQEFGQLVYKLLPNKNEKKLYWDFRSNDKSIVWLDSFYVEKKLEDGTFHSSRKGVARVNVLGTKSTIVDHRTYELPWSVMMEGTVGKFGPNTISLYPATVAREYENICFGENFDNCEFSPFKSLTKANIKFKKVCEKNFGALNFEEAYLLTSPSKKAVYGIWQSSSGSGGTSNLFRIDYSENQKQVCDTLMSGL